MKQVVVGSLGLLIAGSAVAQDIDVLTQQRVLDASGQPLNGTHDLQFRFYDAGGSQVDESCVQGLELQGGYVSTPVPVDPSAFIGGGVSATGGDLNGNGASMGVSVGCGSTASSAVAIVPNPSSLSSSTLMRFEWQGAGDPASSDCSHVGADRVAAIDDALYVCDGSAWSALTTGGGAASIASVTPTSGIQGTVVTVSGLSFGTAPVNLLVGGVDTPVLSQTDTALTFAATLSHGTSAADITVITPANGAATAQDAFALTERTATFAYSGSMAAWVVPNGVTEVEVLAWGAGGSGGGNQASSSAGGHGGGGGAVEATFSVAEGQQLDILVGESRNMGTVGDYAYGGGASGGGVTTQRRGGRGGGRSEVSIAGSPLVVAGGGGGGNSSWENGEVAFVGGAGGGLIGFPGQGSGTVPGGGSQDAGGARGSGIGVGTSAQPSEPGTAGQGGRARGWNNVDVSYGAGGGGGGGYYGGGGGSGGQRSTNAQSGAGGSSHIAPNALSGQHYLGSADNPGLSTHPARAGAGDGGTGSTGFIGTAGGHGRVILTY